MWIYDLQRGVATRLTFGEGYDADPVWSPDGRHIALGQVTDIEVVAGPPMLKSENARLNGWVYADAMR